MTHYGRNQSSFVIVHPEEYTSARHVIEEYHRPLVAPFPRRNERKPTRGSSRRSDLGEKYITGVAAAVCILTPQKPPSDGVQEQVSPTLPCKP
jgi:hypothetical protein